jgi:hypothetical protein
MTIQSSTSDLVMIRTLTGQINSTQKELYAMQKKSTSEFKNEHYYEMDPNLATQNLYVEDLLRKNATQIKNCEWSENLLYMQEASIKRFIDIIGDSKNQMVYALNDSSQVGIPNMIISSKAKLGMIEDELLTEYFGMNIWNGSRTNESPFIENDLVNGTIGANYYQGDNFNLQFYTDDSSVEFGDRANLSCFSDLIKALQIMRDSQNTSDGRANKDDLKNAADLLDKAQVGVLSLLQKIGFVEEAVISAKNHAEEDYSNFSEMYTNSLNGMSEEDRAINLLDAAAVQRKMGYILPITMKYLRDMSIIQYL